MASEWAITVWPMSWPLSRFHRLVGLTLRKFEGWVSGGREGQCTVGTVRELGGTDVVGLFCVGLVEFTALGRAHPSTSGRRNRNQELPRRPLWSHERVPGMYSRCYSVVTDCLHRLLGVVRSRGWRRGRIAKRGARRCDSREVLSVALVRWPSLGSRCQHVVASRGKRGL